MEEKTVANSPILKADKIKKSFSYPINLTILEEISLEIYPGESVAIMGPSGEGKSTLLQILGTLDEPSSGTLHVAGSLVKPSIVAKLRNKHIGFVFQAFNLLEEYTVLQNVLMPAFIAGQSIKKGSAAYERGCALLKRVGLTHRVGYMTKLLSGGEKQRVALARALCNDPDIILADEPTGNLDHTTSKVIHELLLECTTELNKALLVVTHNTNLAAACSRKLFLSSGKLS
jgi:lipoprotein-releasing system ATP-binding protein